MAVSSARPMHVLSPSPDCRNTSLPHWLWTLVSSALADACTLTDVVGRPASSCSAPRAQPNACYRLVSSAPADACTLTVTRHDIHGTFRPSMSPPTCKLGSGRRVYSHRHQTQRHQRGFSWISGCLSACKLGLGRRMCSHGSSRTGQRPAPHRLDSRLSS